jgi:predicted ATP-grasp superfamily ATP-dependent carboligase
MLMDNAAKGIKSAVTTIDDVVVMVVTRFYVHNMIYNPDPYIKGDFRVVAKGAMGLVAKEQIQVRRNEFLNLVLSNQVALQIVGPEGAAYLMRETATGLQMDTDKLVPSSEMLKFKQEQIQAAMQQLQASMPQIAAPQETNAAGDTAPPAMNTVQPQQGVSA